MQNIQASFLLVYAILIIYSSGDVIAGKDGFFMAKGQKAAPRSTWSDERRKNADQYKYNHYSVIGASLDRDIADAFRALCKDQGVSVSSALSKYVRVALAVGTLDIIRDDIPDRENADQENETPGTVDNPENASD